MAAATIPDPDAPCPMLHARRLTPDALPTASCPRPPNDDRPTLRTGGWGVGIGHRYEAIRPACGSLPNCRTAEWKNRKRGHLWSGADSNRRHTAFQAVALPPELPDPACTDPRCSARCRPAGCGLRIYDFEGRAEPARLSIRRLRFHSLFNGDNQVPRRARNRSRDPGADQLNETPSRRSPSRLRRASSANQASSTSFVSPGRLSCGFS